MPSIRKPAIIDFGDCGREAIHRPGAIQSYGALLVVDPGTGLIREASANTAAILGAAPAGLIGAPAVRCLPAEEVPALPAAIAALAEGESVHRGLALSVPTRLTVHRRAGRLLWEFEPEPPAAAGIPDLAAVEEQLAHAGTLYDACQATVQEIFRTAGYDRVMAYRLLPDDTGEVVAEARHPRVAPFMGLRFLPHDFPPQARRLQSLVGVRIIADTGSAPIDLLGADLLGIDLSGAGPGESAVQADLSPVGLRAVSPFCLEFHRAIGVGATLTASIEVAGTLWGILSCHSEAPYRPGWEIRDALRALGRRLGAALERLDAAEAARRARRAARRAERLDALLRGPGNPLAALVAQPDRALSLLGAEGIALVSGDRLLHVGRTPPAADIPGFLQALAGRQPPGAVLAADRAETLAPVGEEWRRDGAGTMAVVVSARPLSGILCFRPELRRDIVWCGDPEHPLTRDAAQRLHPRATFERWHEQVRGEGRPWRADAAALLGTLAGSLGATPAAAVAEAIDAGAGSGSWSEPMPPLSDTLVLTLAEDGSGPARVAGVGGRCSALFDLDGPDAVGAEVAEVLADIGLPAGLADLPDGRAEERGLWSPLLGLRTVRVAMETVRGHRREGTWTRVRRLRLDDVTDYTRTIEALDAARERLVTVERARSTALANMSHELRTPLNAVIGFSELIKLELLGPVGTPAYKGYAGDIMQSGHHLLALISDLLDLSKIEAGRRLLVEQPILFGDLVCEALEWTRVQFRAKTLEWTLSVPDESLALRGDETALRQVLINLMSNAGKFTPPGGTIAVRCTALNNGAVQCEVADSGGGIPESDLPHIFKPFYRAGNPHTVNTEGTGLGLAISKALADLHGGTLELASDGRTGTIARLTLPPWRRCDSGAPR